MKMPLLFSENELTTLFRFATSQTHFYFDGKIFDQVDGVAIGSPLGPVLVKQLPFLDVLSTHSDRLITSVYKKSTFTGLLQNYIYIQERSH